MSDLLSAVEGKPEVGLKIIRLEAENFKRLVAVEIKPDGNMVEITGRNGMGKTSVLDALWGALAGADALQAVPLRRGAEKGHARLELGRDGKIEMVVTRRFGVGKSGPTTSIRVENADGFQAGTPQKMLDGLLGALTFDPLAFMRASEKAQFDMLRGFVTAYDFEAEAKVRKADFDKRTDINRDAKRARAAAEEIVIPSDLPAKLIDEAQLTQELATAGEHNASIEARRDARERAADTIATKRSSATEIEARLPELIKERDQARDDEIADIRAQIAALEAKIVTVRNKWDETTRTQKAMSEQNAANLRTEAEALQSRLDDADSLPDPIDVSALTAKITEARNANVGIRQRNLRDRQIENAEALEAQAQSLTDAIEARDKAKQTAIASAALPVPSIEFGDGALLFNGLPLNQASDAEQLRISVAIAMAMHPKLRVVRVRDGNVLDQEGMKTLAELAQQHDCQVWVETVRADDRIAFVIEDGRVKSHQPTDEGQP